MRRKFRDLVQYKEKRKEEYQDKLVKRKERKNIRINQLREKKGKKSNDRIRFIISKSN